MTNRVTQFNNLKPQPNGFSVFEETMLDPQKIITLSYPTSTLVQAKPAYRKRNLRILSVRDLVSNPITIDEFLRRPLTRRGRYLITAIELDNGLVRQFYPSSSLEFANDCDLRIGLYYPQSKRPDRILSRGYRNTVTDRIALAKATQSIRSHYNPNHIRIFADDLTIAST